ncbi:hypothetical protein U1Q18_052756 [Sarracenia purpurea var. burkii]
MKKVKVNDNQTFQGKRNAYQALQAGLGVQPSRHLIKPSTSYILNLSNIIDILFSCELMKEYNDDENIIIFSPNVCILKIHSHNNKVGKIKSKGKDKLNSSTKDENKRN